MKKDIGLLCSDGLICVHKNKSMKEAYELMKANSVRHLPVVDDLNTVVGMLSDRDVKYAMEYHRWDKWQALDSEPKFHSDDLVVEFMGWPVQTMDEKAMISDAAEQMLKNKISAIIVTRGNLALGIVTTDDLLKVLLNENKSAFEILKNKAGRYVYNTPIGGIAQMLSNIGI